MNEKEWREVIIDACVQARTYKPYFDCVIDTLAQILETRDNIHAQFVEEGSHATVSRFTDRSNKENTVKNPLLTLEGDYNAMALKYWIELGLTSKSLKSIQNGLQTDEGKSVEELLSELENG